MRTTLSIDDDILAAARSAARAQAVSVGQVLSDWARRGLMTPTRSTTSSDEGFPVFDVPSGAKPITLEDVRRIEDEP